MEEGAGVNVPFAKADITPLEEQAVVDVLRSGWLTSGAKMQEFEQHVADYLGGVKALAVNSATSGLHLALQAAGVGPGSQVILPTMTFTATAEAVVYLGATPVFVDVTERSLNMAMKQVRRRLTSSTRAIVPVHFAGLPCAMDELWDLAKDLRLTVIEDAAHALGSTYKGLPIGAGKSLATVFSFYATKCITTAEGGMVVTRDEKLAEHMKTMRLHGISRDVFDRYTTGNWEYDVVEAGFKYNLPDLLAAMGVVQFSRLEEMRHKREAIAKRYTAEFADLPVTCPSENQHGVHSWHLYVIRLQGLDRNKFMSDLMARGIGCSVHFKPLHRMSYWKEFAWDSYPNADKAYEKCVSLPIYSGMSSSQVEQVTEAVKALCS